ncbi:putative beta-lactamase [Nocardia nova SH22a]|uniref:Beta-lactamase n=1 Tax=Nocardia nova SH22a TaxID=1415166 RepID=W5T6V8_9NOCA|nr:putative beta-lactamase [Nocardia nova SH22a]
MLAATAVLVPLAACDSDRSAGPSATSSMPEQFDNSAQDRLRGLEAGLGGRIGVYAVDTGTGRIRAYRADERFPFASTYKALAAGAVLERNKPEALDSRIHYSRDDLVAHSPITGQHVDDGMTLREILDAAVRYSDNTAGNLLFRAVGGPKPLQQQLHEIGDDATSMDRTETDLNQTAPGDIRDTSTPRALGADLRYFALDAAVSQENRRILGGLLRANTTGDTLIRSIAPAGWDVGDKSGSGTYGTRNDIAVLWPPGRAPIVLAVLTTRDRPDAEYDDTVVARAAAIAVTAMNAPQ